jgi:hypothetical protein
MLTFFLLHTYILTIMHGSLRIAKEHDLLILEDDPYIFLYYGDSPAPRSYLSLEKEVNGETGRVIRFDSFSKVVSSGKKPVPLDSMMMELIATHDNHVKVSGLASSRHQFPLSTS